MDSLREHLAALGFSPYEADLYLALLKESPANGSQLARRSGVPRSMAYQTLDRLVEKGAVLIAPGDPAWYSPVSPAEFFARLRERYAQSCQALIDGLPQVANTDTGLIWNLVGLDPIRNRAADMYFRAGGQIRTGGDSELLARLLPGADRDQGAPPPGRCVLLIPHQEALMVEVSRLSDPVGAYGRQSAFLAAATAFVKEPVGLRQRPQAVPIRQFW